MVRQPFIGFTGNIPKSQPTRTSHNIKLNLGFRLDS